MTRTMLAGVSTSRRYRPATALAPGPASSSGAGTGSHGAHGADRGVVARWLAGWGEAMDDAYRDLQWCVAGMDGKLDMSAEWTRRWLVLDWMVRNATPRWLRALGLSDHADALATFPPVGSTAALVRAAPVAQRAAAAAHERHQTTWDAVVGRAQPDAHDPVRSRVWLSVVEGTQIASRSVWTIIDAATCATGYSLEPERAPNAWNAVVDTITHAAAALAWNASSVMTERSAWSWQAPPGAARALAYSSARAALAPIEASVQGAVCQLFAMMYLVAPASRQLPVHSGPDRRPDRDGR